MLTQTQLNHSKTISYYLRHKPEDLNIQLDIEGWINVDEFLSKYNTAHNSNLELSDILDILSGSDKKRWEIEEDSNSIRAIYGHSIDTLEIGYPKLTEPIKLYHGTPTANLESIKKKGILSMSRHFVHLTPDQNLALKTAKRISKDVVALEIDVVKMLNDGIIIYKASDVVYLVKNVSTEFTLFKQSSVA